MTQREALDILKTGKSAFVTGAAGSGKTHLLREYISYLKQKNIPVAVTASTGIAATHMGGMTIHAWSGIGIRDDLSPHEAREIAGKSNVKSRLLNTKVLIIDEISMLHHFRLDLVDMVLRASRGTPETPFGGVQVIFSGDFYQLPPVSRAGERGAKFAYHADAWKSLDPAVCYLEEQHRQNDQQFLRILDEIRSGEVSEEMGEMLRSRFGKAPGSIVTKLYSHNNSVDAENESELSKVPGGHHEYRMRSKGNTKLVETLKKSCLAPELLKLKTGAKVMFVKNNYEEGYVNGTLGTVEKCGAYSIVVRTNTGKRINVSEETWGLMNENGKSIAEIEQYPLRLAWAITVHKSQGMSLDSAEIDLSASFERGMGYVALSRVRSLDGLYLRGINHMALQVSEEAVEMDRSFRELSAKHVNEMSLFGPSELAQMHTNFADKAGETKSKKPDTISETKRLLVSGMNIADIVEVRGLAPGTILDHIEMIKESDPSINIFHLKDALSTTRFQRIYRAFQQAGTIEGGKRPLKPVHDILGDSFSYDELKIVRLFL